mgnify:CR=1 FL=1
MLVPVLMMWIPSLVNSDMIFDVRDIPITPERNFFIQGFMGMAWFMLPASVVICTVLLTRTELSHRGIVKMLSLPVSRTKVSLAKEYSDFSDCDIILSAAAKPFSKEIKDRAQELQMNVEIIAPICEQLKKHCKPTTVVIVSANPVDVFVYIYQKLLGWDKKAISGSGRQ